MKVKLNINGEDVEVTLTPEQLAQIEEQKKPKKFEMKYLKNKTYLLDRGEWLRNQDGSYIHCLDNGWYRLTEESSKRSLARNKRANRLEALVDQLGGMKKWIEGDKDNCYIYFSAQSNKYNAANSSDYYHTDKVYMTSNCANEVCRILNAGEYSLEGEES